MKRCTAQWWRKNKAHSARFKVQKVKSSWCKLELGVFIGVQGCRQKWCLKGTNSTWLTLLSLWTSECNMRSNWNVLCVVRSEAVVVVCRFKSSNWKLAKLYILHAKRVALALSTRFHEKLDWSVLCLCSTPLVAQALQWYPSQCLYYHKKRISLTVCLNIPTEPVVVYWLLHRRVVQVNY